MDDALAKGSVDGAIEEDPRVAFARYMNGPGYAQYTRFILAALGIDGSQDDHARSSMPWARSAACRAGKARQVPCRYGEDGDSGTWWVWL